MRIAAAVPRLLVACVALILFVLSVSVAGADTKPTPSVPAPTATRAPDPTAVVTPSGQRRLLPPTVVRSANVTDTPRPTARVEAAVSPTTAASATTAASPTAPPPASPTVYNGRDWPSWCDNRTLGGRWLRQECVVILVDESNGAPYYCVGVETPPNRFWPSDMPPPYIPVCAERGSNIAYAKPWGPRATFTSVPPTTTPLPPTLTPAPPTFTRTPAPTATATRAAPRLRERPPSLRPLP